MLLNRFAIVILLVSFAVSHAAAADRPPPKSPAMLAALKLEDQASDKLPLDRWTGDKIRELARTINSMPEELAAETLWLVATAPTSLDTNVLFATALSSPSANVRGLAASLLAGGISSDSRRFLLNTLASEKNPEIIRTIIHGMSNLPLHQSVRGLMDVMYLPGEHPPVVEEASSELRRLTKADIGANAGDWRDWWLDNEGKY